MQANFNFAEARSVKGPAAAGARLESSPFSENQVRAAAEAFGTPLYLYSMPELERRAKILLGVDHAFGYTARFAMKACSNSMVLRVLHRLGMHFDASSGYEAQRALAAGIPASSIKLTTQELPRDLEQLVASGVIFNACSLQQLAAYGKLFAGREVSLRVNPGLGSGHTNRCNTGGPASSFGIWHEHVGEAKEIADRCNLRITGLHSHIGAGTDPAVWVRVAGLTLSMVEHFPEVVVVNLGGGFKVARIPGEDEADVADILGRHIKALFEQFASAHGRRLHLEVEPGTWLAANFGALVTAVQDRSDTGAAGYRFLKADAGMGELLRPAIYGAQHAIELVPREGSAAAREQESVLVVGHCCESGDIFTPAPGDPEGLLPRELPRAEIGDLLVIGAAGAYGAGFSTVNYNSFPAAPQVLLDHNGDLHEIRVRQTLEQQLVDERVVAALS